MDMSWNKFWEMVKDGEVWYAAIQGVTKIQTQMSNWKTTMCQKLSDSGT